MVKMEDKISRLTETDKALEAKVENLTERVIRLEAFMEVAMMQASGNEAPKPARQKLLPR
jgi:hypothetical protein